MDTREKADYKKGHISQAVLHDITSSKKLDFKEVVVYDKDEITSASNAEKISKNNSIKVLYLEGGIQSWTDNNFPLVEEMTDKNVQFNIQRIYLKDISFESPMTPDVFTNMSSTPKVGFLILSLIYKIYQKIFMN